MLGVMIVASEDSYVTVEWPRPEPLKRDEWHAQEIAETERSLNRHKDENQKEIGRASRRTEWVAALRKSLVA